MDLKGTTNKKINKQKASENVVTSIHREGLSYLLSALSLCLHSMVQPSQPLLCRGPVLSNSQESIPAAAGVPGNPQRRWPGFPPARTPLASPLMTGEGLGTSLLEILLICWVFLLGLRGRSPTIPFPSVGHTSAWHPQSGALLRRKGTHHKGHMDSEKNCRETWEGTFGHSPSLYLADEVRPLLSLPSCRWRSE